MLTVKLHVSPSKENNIKLYLFGCSWPSTGKMKIVLHISRIIVKVHCAVLNSLLNTAQIYKLLWPVITERTCEIFLHRNRIQGDLPLFIEEMDNEENSVVV